MVELVRIQKALAEAGVASRRTADDLVGQGRVSVNGVAATLGQRVDPSHDRISVDGQPVGARPRPVYLALHKPAGVTSTVADRHAEQTVVSLIPDELRRSAGRVYPVGRLDRDAEGLLLLTNDGDWAQAVLHPRHVVEREYAVAVDTPLTADQARALLDGVALEEEIGRLNSLRRASAAETSRLPDLRDRPGAAPARSGAGQAGRGAGHGSPGAWAWYRVVLTQGWRRQIRRMFAAVGAPVRRLVRVRVGAVRLEGLAPGAVRALSATERDRLGAAARSAAPRHAPAADPTAGYAPRGSRGLVVSIDGPGSSGKSSVGARAARIVGFRFLDTGLLYRALAWLAIERHVDPEDAGGLVRLVPDVSIAADESGNLCRVHAGRLEVTTWLHSADVERVVSLVARQPALRAALLPMQRRIAEPGAIIMAGRDIGTVVLPDADLKLYLDVSVAERARRRIEERGLAPGSAEALELEAELLRRDELDSTRAAAPLRVPEGATVINTDENRLEDSVASVVDLIRRREASQGTGGATR